MTNSDSNNDWREFKKLSEDRPVRDKFEEVTDKIPEGPMGKVGGGNLIGVGGYTAVESTRPVWQFLPGIKQPGYSISAHGTRSIAEGVERHVLTVNAVSEKVAEFAAEYTAAPSNIDYIRSEVRTVDVEIITERGTYTTYQFTVDVITDVE